MDDTDDKTGGVVVPLFVIRGEGIDQHSAIPGEVRLVPGEDMKPVLEVQTALNLAYIRLGSLDAQIIALALQKGPVVDEIRAHQAKLLEVAREVARKLGIDPDSKTIKWNFDIDRCIFRRLE